MWVLGCVLGQVLALSSSHDEATLRGETEHLSTTKDALKKMLSDHLTSVEDDDEDTKETPTSITNDRVSPLLDAMEQRRDSARAILNLRARGGAAASFAETKSLEDILRERKGSPPPPPPHYKCDGGIMTECGKKLDVYNEKMNEQFNHVKAMINGPKGKKEPLRKKIEDDNKNNKETLKGKIKAAEGLADDMWEEIAEVDKQKAADAKHHMQLGGATSTAVSSVQKSLQGAVNINTGAEKEGELYFEESKTEADDDQDRYTTERQEAVSDWGSETDERADMAMENTAKYLGRTEDDAVQINDMIETHGDDHKSMLQDLKEGVADYSKENSGLLNTVDQIKKQHKEVYKKFGAEDEFVNLAEEQEVKRNANMIATGGKNELRTLAVETGGEVQEAKGDEVRSLHDDVKDAEKFASAVDDKMDAATGSVKNALNTVNIKVVPGLTANVRKMGDVAMEAGVLAGVEEMNSLQKLKLVEQLMAKGLLSEANMQKLAEEKMRGEWSEEQEIFFQNLQKTTEDILKEQHGQLNVDLRDMEQGIKKMTTLDAMVAGSASKATYDLEQMLAGGIPDANQMTTIKNLLVSLSSEAREELIARVKSGMNALKVPAEDMGERQQSLALHLGLLQELMSKGVTDGTEFVDAQGKKEFTTLHDLELHLWEQLHDTVKGIDEAKAHIEPMYGHNMAPSLLEELVKHRGSRFPAVPIFDPASVEAFMKAIHDQLAPQMEALEDSTEKSTEENHAAAVAKIQTTGKESTDALQGIVDSSDKEAAVILQNVAHSLTAESSSVEKIRANAEQRMDTVQQAEPTAAASYKEKIEQLKSAAATLLNQKNLNHQEGSTDVDGYLKAQKEEIAFVEKAQAGAQQELDNAQKVTSEAIYTNLVATEKGGHQAIAAASKTYVQKFAGIVAEGGARIAAQSSHMTALAEQQRTSTEEVQDRFNKLAGMTQKEKAKADSAASSAANGVTSLQNEIEYQKKQERGDQAAMLEKANGAIGDLTAAAKRQESEMEQEIQAEVSHADAVAQQGAGGVVNSAHQMDESENRKMDLVVKESNQEASRVEQDMKSTDATVESFSQHAMQEADSLTKEAVEAANEMKTVEVEEKKQLMAAGTQENDMVTSEVNIADGLYQEFERMQKSVHGQLDGVMNVWGVKFQATTNNFEAAAEEIGSKRKAHDTVKASLTKRGDEAFTEIRSQLNASSDSRQGIDNRIHEQTDMMDQNIKEEHNIMVHDHTTHKEYINHVANETNDKMLSILDSVTSAAKRWNEVLNASKAKQEGYEENLEAISKLESTHDREDVERAYTAGHAVDLTAMELEQWASGFASYDLDFKDAVRKKLESLGIKINSDILDAIRSTHSSRMEEGMKKNEVHKAFENALANEESMEKDEITQLYLAQDAAIGKIMRNAGLSASQKAAMVQRIKEETRSTAGLLISDEGTMEERQAKLAKQLEEYQQQVKQALAIGDSINADMNARAGNARDYKQKSDLLKDQVAELANHPFLTNANAQGDAPADPVQERAKDAGGEAGKAAGAAAGEAAARQAHVQERAKDAGSEAGNAAGAAAGEAAARQVHDPPAEEQGSVGHGNEVLAGSLAEVDGPISVALADDLALADADSALEDELNA